MKSRSRLEQQELLDKLFNSISQEHVSDSTLDLLKEVLGKSSMLRHLKTYQVDENNILQEAAVSLRSTEVIKLLAEKCPGLVMHQSEGEYAGRTALHILVSGQNLEGAKALLDSITRHKDVKKLLEAKVSLPSCCLIFNLSFTLLTSSHSVGISTSLLLLLLSACILL